MVWFGGLQILISMIKIKLYTFCRLFGFVFRYFIIKRLMSICWFLLIASLKHKVQLYAVIVLHFPILKSPVITFIGFLAHASRVLQEFIKGIIIILIRHLSSDLHILEFRVLELSLLYHESDSWTWRFKPCYYLVILSLHYEFYTKFIRNLMKAVVVMFFFVSRIPWPIYLIKWKLDVLILKGIFILHIIRYLTFYNG